VRFQASLEAIGYAPREARTLVGRLASVALT